MPISAVRIKKKKKILNGKRSLKDMISDFQRLTSVKLLNM